MTSIETVSETIGAIYDSAVDPEGWPVALERIAGMLGGRTASIGISDAVTRETLIRVSWGVPEPFLSNYAEYVASMPFYALYARMGVEEVKAGSSMYDMDAFRRSRFYLEWARPQGLEDVAALCVMNDVKRFGIFGVNIGGDRDLVGPRDLETLRMLAPHIRRAATIGDLLDTGSLAAARLESALDALATGVLLVDGNLRILHANKAALALTDTGEGLSLAGERMTVASPASARALALAVARAREGDAALGRSGFNLPVPGPAGQTLILHVLPVGHGVRRRALETRAVAAVFVTVPSTLPAAPVDAIAALYDLSRAESLVLDRIGAGRTPAETAVDLGVAPATVKSHLVRVFRKTGTARQAELVKLMGSLAVAIAVPS